MHLKYQGGSAACCETAPPASAGAGGAIEALVGPIAGAPCSLPSRLKQSPTL
jgi:hypothetical protein